MAMRVLVMMFTVCWAVLCALFKASSGSRERESNVVMKVDRTQYQKRGILAGSKKSIRTIIKPAEMVLYSALGIMLESVVSIFWLDKKSCKERPFDSAKVVRKIFVSVSKL